MARTTRKSMSNLPKLSLQWQKRRSGEDCLKKPSKVVPKSFKERLGRPPGALSRPFWPLLGRSWDALGRFCAAPGASWEPLGASWEPLGSLLGCLGASWEPHEASWERLGSLLGALGSVLGTRLERVLEAFSRHLGAVWMVFWSLGSVFEAISCNIEKP